MQNTVHVWHKVRGGLPRFGWNKEHFAGYLVEFLFKQKYSMYTERLHAFFCMVGELYFSPAPQ